MRSFLSKLPSSESTVKKLRNPVSVVSALTLLLFATPIHGQQSDPRAALGQIIQAFQLCGPPHVYQMLSPQMLQLVAQQTGGSGCYPAIRAAGPITHMQILQQQQYPTGPIYLIRVTHQSGPVDWFIGFNQFTSQIEYLSFQPPQTGTSIQTGPSPSAGGPGPVTSPLPTLPQPPGGGVGGGQTDGCSLYPAMCQ
jgi:hypothetical protein